MATNLRRFDLHFRSSLLLLWFMVHSGDGYTCNYGQNCAFEPAPPGRVPPCALPGLTYCIHPELYPETIIRHLVDAGHYDIRTLLSDESRDEYNSRRKDYPYGYGPNSLPNVDQISLVDDSLYQKPHYNTKFHTSYNQDNIFSQKTPLQPPSPVDPTPYNINAYQMSNFTKFAGFHGYHTSSPRNYWNPTQHANQYDDYTKKYFLQNQINPTSGPYNPNFYTGKTFNPNYDSTNWYHRNDAAVTQYNPGEWWKNVGSDHSNINVMFPYQPPVTRRNSSSLVHGRQRRNAELVKAAARRPLTGAEALRIALGFASAETSAERTRRQVTNTQQLCAVRTQFITPRAALNNKGNWKYVVNMPSNMTQLVRAEICMSTQCSGLCSLPLGYTSRCEQKYVQKRLVALESNGQNLYTDIFWIPSCCQCTIIAN